MSPNPKRIKAFFSRPAALGSRRRRRHDPNPQKSQELGIETTGPFLGPASNLHRRARGPRLILPRQPKRSKNPSQDLPLSTSPHAADASPGAIHLEHHQRPWSEKRRGDRPAVIRQEFLLITSNDSFSRPTADYKSNVPMGLCLISKRVKQPPDRETSDSTNGSGC